MTEQDTTAADTETETEIPPTARPATDDRRARFSPANETNTNPDRNETAEASAESETDTDYIRPDARSRGRDDHRDDRPDDDSFQYATPLVDEAARASTTHARYDDETGAWACVHCGRSKEGWTPNAVNGHLSGCPNYPPTGPIARLSSLTTEDITTALRKKFDDKRERTLVAVGFLAGVSAYPGLENTATLLALAYGATLVMLCALYGDADWIGASPRLQRALTDERNEVMSRFNVEGKAFQVGFGVGAAVLASVAAELFGYDLAAATEPLRQALRLFGLGV